MDARTVDAVATGEQQPESDHAMQAQNSYSGVHENEAWRDARSNGYFQYTLQTGGEYEELSLMVRYWGNEGGSRAFSILVDGELLAQENVTGKWNKNEFVNVEYPIPAEMVRGKAAIAVRFLCAGSNIAGGVFYVRLLKPYSSRAPSVTISGITPDNPRVAKGATLQLTANVATTDGADSTVAWSVSGGVSMTGITAAGLLSVAAGETAATLTVTATSVYDNTQSASTTVTVTAAATAVEKTPGALTLSAYPNPTGGVVYVENEANSEVELYSVGGELLLRTAGSAVDLSAFPSGVYLVKIGEKAAKVVKK